MQTMSVPNSVGGVDHGSWCQVQFASRPTSVKGAAAAGLSQAEMVEELTAQHQGQREPEPEAVVEIANARVDFLGNVSDAFNGEVILFSIKNFNATVTLQPGAPGIRILPHPKLDSSEYTSFEDLDKMINGFGYYGGVRLMQATCKHFFAWCKEHAVELDMSRTGFSMSYDTTIPRKAGMSGSSAIVCAALRCLLRHYDVEIPVVEQPAFIQQTERELGISADLQDRVVQVFGGLMHLDFSDLDLVTTDGCGTYSALEPSRLPPLYLMYCGEGSKSTSELEAIEIMQANWHEGDESVRERMQEMASCARQGRVALERWDVGTLGQLMTKNYELKRDIMGVEAMGASNIRMVEMAQAFGCAAKPCGSGGSVVVLCPRGKPQVEQLKAAAQAEGFHFLQAEVAPR